jgi:hypothetical protein
MSESSTDESYFHDPTNAPALRRTHRRGRPSTGSMAAGHGHQRQASDALRLPPHVIPYGPADGVFGMMKRVVAWKTEGWLSLWKSWPQETLVLNQPTNQSCRYPDFMCKRSRLLHPSTHYSQRSPPLQSTRLAAGPGRLAHGHRVHPLAS